ncbi:MAG: hypothetical protein K2O09_05105, partial [Treponemataceae bacterium]|nr:hypothetical protein [Treponemataceae bacterium]
GASFLFFRDILSFRLEAGELSWERGNPLLPKRGFPLSQTLTPSQHGLGLHPKTPLAPLARHGFGLQKILSLLSLRVFRPQKHSHGLSGRIFVLQKYSQGFLKAFLRFGSIPKRFPACFRSSGAFPRVSRRVFDVREHSQEFPGAVSAFGNIPTAFPACFRSLGAFPRLSRRTFSVWEWFSALNSAKNI